LKGGNGKDAFQALEIMCSSIQGIPVKGTIAREL
jgi:hypothetical protein